MNGMLASAWSYRQFIISSIKKDFRARFVRSRLGGFWMILHPLAQVVMYALVLSAVLAAKMPESGNRFAYAQYITAGILAWSLFSELVTRCVTLFIDNANLLKKMAFPRICLPMIVAGSVLVNNVLLLVCILLIFAALGNFPSQYILWVPVLQLLTVGIGLGLGLFLGVLNVFIRDVGQVVPVLLQFGFWFTPIVYMAAIVPERFHVFFELNPMYHVTNSFQNVLVFGRPPQWTSLMVIMVTGVVLLAFALLVFRKASSEMVDEL